MADGRRHVGSGFCLLALALAAETALAAPSFTSAPVTAANEDASYTYEVRTTDNQSGQRRITAPTLPSWLTLSNVNLSSGSARLSGTPTQAHVGAHAVTLLVTNISRNTSATQSFTITVANVNDAPVITGQTPNPIVLARNTSLTIQLSHLIVSDPDDSYPSDFSLTVLNGSNYSRNGNTITPTTNFTGTLSVPVRVNDGAANSNTFNLQVSVQIVNRPPEIVAPIPSQTGREGQPFQLRNGAGSTTTLAAFFRDLDGDPLRYEVTGLPPSGSLVANVTTGAITGTPLATDARDTPYVVRVTANDSRSPASQLPTQSFDLMITALARPDIALSITVVPAPAVVNTAVEWRFAIGNGAQQAVGPVELTAEFAGNPLSFGPVPSCTVTPVMDRQRMVCSVASIGAGATVTIIATSRAAQSGDATATADAVLLGSPGPDPNPANNRATATLNVAQTLSTGPAQVLPSPDSRKAAAGDINGDGFVDLALAKGAGSSAEFYLNVQEAAPSAKRKLSETPMALVAAIPASDVALADLDRDGDLDLVMANNTGQGSTVFQNGGLGTFTLLATIASGTSNAVAAADFDGDGFADLAFANASASAVYLNRAGTFTRSATLGNDDSRQVIAVDLDLDNLPDLVFANANGPSRFYRNLGGGSFAAGVVVDAGGAESVASGDFNRDGRADLVFGQLSTQSSPPSNPVYQNNPGATGAPSFVLTGRLGASPTIDVLATDVDVDGTTDVVVITSTGTHQVYRGDGAGGFSLHPVQFSSATATGAVLGSFNADTRVDLAVGGTASNGVFFNDGRGALGPGDTSPPVIQLVGEATVTVTVSQAYQDAGASATDDIDGNLTSKIVTNNNVDTSIIGTYRVTYDVVDTSGNAATQVTRTVRITPREAAGGGGGGAIGLLDLVVGLLVAAFCIVAVGPTGRAS